ncbi:hypothetical protein [Sulfobacillus thermosulfidooxidans]|uniref:hypothetical protein n=1 Tax=Sulfobacillus thermosulfidooxidans TaxID=28034 RepID=UPI0002EDCB41|nr:hypothetical protein [Sulfobacillus thermosulfidooxidans]
MIAAYPTRRAPPSRKRWGFGLLMGLSLVAVGMHAPPAFARDNLERWHKVWYTVRTWHPGHSVSYVYWQPVWHPGYTSHVWHPGYSTSVWHPGYTSHVWHPGYTSKVWHPGYSTSVQHAGYYTTVSHPATTKTVDEPHTTAGYWKTVQQTVAVQQTTWHTATVQQTVEVPHTETLTGWHTVDQIVWEPSSSDTSSAKTAYVIALPAWMQTWGAMMGHPTHFGGQTGSGDTGTGTVTWIPVEKPTRVYSTYTTTVDVAQTQWVTTQVPVTVTVEKTETAQVWVPPVTTEVPVTVHEPGYTTKVWHPGYTTKVWHPGYDTSVYHPGYSTSVWHPGYTSHVWHPRYSTPVWHAGYMIRERRVGHQWHSGYYTTYRYRTFRWVFGL